MDDAKYDPFARGPFPVGVRTIQAADQARGRVFPCEIWYPARSEDADRSAGQDSGRDAAARPGAHPLIVFSHYSGGHRRSATFLSTHLASHGHVVGLVGHSFGGWTVLATPDAEPRVRAVAAFGPGGSAHPKPGILPLTLHFAWSQAIPTLYLAAADDVPIPLTGVYELFDRTPTPKRMFVLRRADHQHFLDDVEGEHEAVRAMSFPGPAAWIPAAMRPITELSSGEQAHLFVRGLTLGHLDAALRQLDAAERFLDGDVESELAARGVDAFAHRT